jgi:hypothetical protein
MDLFLTLINFWLSLQEKLPWPTKLKSRRGCWCTMADDFGPSVVHVKTFFFSFLRPPSPTKAAKTWRMVARDVVHLEISGSPAESTQIRTAEGCRAQMAASLALFFFYIAPSRSTFSDRAVYDAGSWVPHVILYEPKFFLFLDFF